MDALLWFNSNNTKMRITPITKIPIYPDSHLAQQEGGLGIILAWNIGDTIKKSLLEINPKIKVIGI